MLRAGRMVPAINRLGGGMIALAGAQPWRVVGSEAVVYQLRQSSGRVFALRCLFADTLDPGLADRYRALGADAAIKRFRSRPFSPVVGGVSFIPDGIVLPSADLRSSRSPMVAMDWVMGPTLMAAVDRACRGNDQQYLLALAEAWRTAMLMCSEESFIHGDLTAHNAMVRPKEGIALVDYDQSWWPTAPVMPASVGRPGFRHPRGVPSHVEQRDDFPALVIYASLRILAVWPELRFEHGSAAVENDGVLLFSAKDLANPDGSALFGKIRVIDDPVVQALVGVLRETCRLQPEEVPPFREAIHAAGNVARTLPAARPAPPSPAPTSRQGFQERVSKLNGLLIAGNADEAWSFWRSSGLSDDPEARRELGPVMADIERRRSPRLRAAPREDASMRSRLATAAVEQLRAAMDVGDGAAVVRIWSEVRNEPAASTLAAQASQVITAHLTGKLEAAVASGDDQAIVDAAAETKRHGVAIRPALRRETRAAARRLAVKEELEEALAQDDRAALAQHAAAGVLEELNVSGGEIERRLTLAEATPHLLRAIATDDDHIIDQAWDREIFPDFSDLPVSVHNRLTQARDRVAWLAKARAALKARDAGEMASLMSVMPLGAEDRLSSVERARMRRLIRQENAVDGLRSALDGGDDRQIVDALNELEAAGGHLPEDLNWSAVRGVIDRLSLIASIRRAALSKPPDYTRLSRLLPQAREESNGETPYLGGNLDFKHLETEVKREAHRNRLLDAIERGDQRAIVAAAVPDPHGILADLKPEQRRTVDEAIAEIRPKNPLKKRA